MTLGIIFLFLGIAAQPVTSINITHLNEFESFNKINIFYRQDDCNCEDINAQDLVEVKTLLDKTEIIIKNILLTYGYISDIKLKCNELLTLLDTSSNDGPICILLFVLFFGIGFIYEYFHRKEYDFNAMGKYVIANICLLIYSIIGVTILVPIQSIATYLLRCDWATYPLRFNF